MQASATDFTPALVTITEAIEPYRGVTVAMVRAWCRQGRLPFVRAGKRNLLDPRDLARLLAPKLRTVAPHSEPPPAT
jgi:hypothetical protein